MIKEERKRREIQKERKKMMEIAIDKNRHRERENEVHRMIKKFEIKG